MIRLALVVVSFVGAAVAAFQPLQVMRHLKSSNMVLYYVDDENKQSGEYHGQDVDKGKSRMEGLWNPFQEVSEMIESWDDVMDDFFHKRMGNGEVFYGTRKYKPSGRKNTQGKYNGMGLSDSAKIEVARSKRAEFLEQKRRQMMEKEDQWERRNLMEQEDQWDQ